jgi:D-aminopeptidase
LPKIFAVVVYAICPMQYATHLILMDTPSPRSRLRDLGIVCGVLPTGARNQITDVAGVRVGQVTLIEGSAIRTGVTAILPHGGNLFQDKVPAGVVVGNGFGKLMGSTQLQALGEIETPLLLTNTLSVPTAASAIIEWTLQQPGNESVVSINPIVGETNDGYLNDIRARVLTIEHCLQAIETATEGNIAEGTVGAGTGTIAFGWKGGIGTSSRRLPHEVGGYTVGVLVQSNFGGVLSMAGVPVGQALGKYYLKSVLDPANADGSIMIIVATDAPLSDRNLTRLAARAMAGLARTGAAFSNGSGDYAIAFNTCPDTRRTTERRQQVTAYPEMSNDAISPLFLATIEATEEAIYNSLLMATTVQGFRGTVEAIPIDAVMTVMRQYGRMNANRDTARG